MMPLKEHYKTNVVSELKDKLGLDSVMAVPKVTKVTLNMGVGEAMNDKKLLERAVEDMTLIAGQKPLVTKARKSVANFKIRDGMPIGCKVTLRGDRMYDFLQRLIGIAIPISLSKNSYILSPLKVTLQPIGIPSLILKLATDFLALVTNGF